MELLWKEDGKAYFRIAGRLGMRIAADGEQQLGLVSGSAGECKQFEYPSDPKIEFDAWVKQHRFLSEESKESILKKTY